MKLTYNGKKIVNKDDIKKWIILGVIISFCLVLVLSSVYTIGAGERGVLLTFGKVGQLAQDEGLHLKIPFVQQIVKMDVKTQKYEAEASAASRDLQTVTSKIATNYHLVPETIPVLYQDIGVNYQIRVIQPLEQEVVKSITAKFTAEELITKREEVRLEMKQILHERLLGRGIIVEDVSIVNFDFSPEFNKAIELKVTAQQQMLKAQNDLERIKIEAEQKVVSAKAEAEALSVQKSQITNDLLRLRQIEVQR